MKGNPCRHTSLGGLRTFTGVGRMMFLLWLVGLPYFMVGQRLDYLEVSNPLNAFTSLQAFDNRLVLSQEVRGNTFYEYHTLDADFTPGSSGRLNYIISLSNTTGLIRMHTLSDGTTAMMGRRPGGETFVSRWDGSNFPLWAYRLKSGDSPDLPRRNLFVSGTDTLVVVDIFQANSTTKRLYITVIDRAGKLVYSNSIFRKDIDWTKMDADCDNGEIWVCGQPKSDTSSILSWSVNQGQITHRIDIPGYDVQSIQILSDGHLLIAGKTINDKSPFVSIINPMTLETIKALKVTTLNPFVDPIVHAREDGQSIYLDIQGANDPIRRIIQTDRNLQVLSSFSLSTGQPSRALVIGNRYFTLANYQNGLTPIICRYDPDDDMMHCELRDFCFDRQPVSLICLPGKAFSLFGGTVLRDLNVTRRAASGLSYRDTCLGVETVPFADFDIDRDTFCVGECVDMYPLGNGTADEWEWKVSGPLDSIWSRDSLPDCFRFDRPGHYDITHKITFEGCVYTASRQIFISNALVDYDIPDLYLCPGTDTTISVPGGIRSLRWEDGSTTRNRTFDRAGSYSLQGVNEAGCPVQDSFTVFEITAPSIDLTPGDTLICEEDELMLRVSPTPGTTYLWSTGATGHQIVVDQAGTYRVVATNACGMDSASVRIQVKPCKVRVFIPNVFTPNGDGVNDVFEVYLHNADFVTMEIFDRWGNLVYRSDGNREPWNGSKGNVLFPVSVYVYKLEYKDIFTGKILTRSGDITLIR